MTEGKVRILRYDPEQDAAPCYKTYSFPFEPGMSVLDVCNYLYGKVDGSLGYSYCCRNSHCGLCGAMINGKAGLMCREAATPDLVLEPLANLPVLRDLIVDRDLYCQGKAALRLFLERAEPRQASNQPEAVDMACFDLFRVASRCVACYCCLAVCPVYQETPHAFAGPAAFVQLARHAFDPRDDGSRAVMALSSGLNNCIACGRCTQACPHGIAPDETIRLLQAMLAKGRQA